MSNCVVITSRPRKQRSKLAWTQESITIGGSRCGRLIDTNRVVVCESRIPTLEHWAERSVERARAGLQTGGAPRVVSTGSAAAWQSACQSRCCGATEQKTHLKDSGVPLLPRTSIQGVHLPNDDGVRLLASRDLLETWKPCTRLALRFQSLFETWAGTTALAGFRGRVTSPRAWNVRHGGPPSRAGTRTRSHLS